MLGFENFLKKICSFFGTNPKQVDKITPQQMSNNNGKLESALAPYPELLSYQQVINATYVGILEEVEKYLKKYPYLDDPTSTEQTINKAMKVIIDKLKNFSENLKTKEEQEIGVYYLKKESLKNAIVTMATFIIRPAFDAKKYSEKSVAEVTYAINGFKAAVNEYSAFKKSNKKEKITKFQDAIKKLDETITSLLDKLKQEVKSGDAAGFVLPAGYSPEKIRDLFSSGHAILNKLIQDYKKHHGVAPTNWINISSQLNQINQKKDFKEYINFVKQFNPVCKKQFGMELLPFLTQVTTHKKLPLAIEYDDSNINKNNMKKIIDEAKKLKKELFVERLGGVIVQKDKDTNGQVEHLMNEIEKAKTSKDAQKHLDALKKIKTDKEEAEKKKKEELENAKKEILEKLKNNKKKNTITPFINKAENIPHIINILKKNQINSAYYKDLPSFKKHCE